MLEEAIREFRANRLAREWEIRDTITLCTRRADDARKALEKAIDEAREQRDRITCSIGSPEWDRLEKDLAEANLRLNLRKAHRDSILAKMDAAIARCTNGFRDSLTKQIEEAEALLKGAE